MAIQHRTSTLDRLLLTTPDDTEDAPWMVMADLQVLAAELLRSILRLHVQRQGLDWYLASYLKVTMRRPDGRPLDVAPDLLMADGADRLRTSWNVAPEGRPPQFVLEISSSESWRRDTKEKPGIYDAMGVREFLIFAPQRRGGPLLFGYRRDADDAFVQIASDADGLLASQELGGLRLYVDSGRWLRVLDQEGRRLLSEGEEAHAERAAHTEAEQRAATSVAARADAERRAQVDAAARAQAEQHAADEAVARAQAEQRAEAEAAARADAEQHAEAEAAARAAAEAEVARLQAELRRLRGA